jgi:uncharacterized membrane protein YgdD (TMEM256/DUF423 family)
MNFIKIASISAAIAVVLGAFGAHAFKNLLSPELLEAWRTAVAYQIYHALALLIVGFLSLHPIFEGSRALVRSAYAFIVGAVFFSGSIYVLCLSRLYDLPMLAKVAGPITPIGGVFFILGWVLLFLAMPKRVNS